MRTHTCGELRADHLGMHVQLAGWIRFSRDHGGVLFFDLADAYGTTRWYDPEAMSGEGDREPGKDAQVLRPRVCNLGRRNGQESCARDRGPRNPPPARGADRRGLSAELIKTSPFEVADQKGSLLPRKTSG